MKMFLVYYVPVALTLKQAYVFKVCYCDKGV